MDQGKSLRQLIARNAVEAGTVALRQIMRGLRQLLRSHVVRRRIDEVAREICRFRRPTDLGAINAFGRHQLDLGGVSLAVSTEPIAAERKRERCQVCIIRRIGEMIAAWRQQTWQGAGPEQVAELTGFVIEAEQDLRDPAVSRG